MSKPVVIESPLNGPTPEAIARNFRFLLWCCRAVWLREGAHAIASHLMNPWWMDDADPAERQAGIDNAWVWSGERHMAFIDLGESGGMGKAKERCRRDRIGHTDYLLSVYAPDCWAAFQRGEFPPHTAGFELAGGAQP